MLLSYTLGMKYKFYRKILRFLGKRTFVKRDSLGNLVTLIWISGGPAATSRLSSLLCGLGWTEET